MHKQKLSRREKFSLDIDHLDTDSIQDRVVSELFIGLDTPVSLSCYLLYKYKEYGQLVCKEIDPLQYNEADKFADDFLSISLLKKNNFLKTGIDTKAVALEKFLECEQACKETNKRIRSWQGINPDTSVPINAIVERARFTIAKILGDGDPDSDFPIDEFLDSCAWGPGTSFSLRGKELSASRKYREELDITSSAYQFWLPILEAAYPLWLSPGRVSKIREQNFSRVMTVPKNAKTDRPISVEPGFNLWIQKGLGKLIRRRLCHAGVDLNRSDLNIQLARKGSKDDSYCTVDFSSASDTISKEVVKLLLPRHWYTCLDLARTPLFSLENKISIFEKFSSMGNGFTFELESLIFYALAEACHALTRDFSVISVFGDDVVMKKRHYPWFVEVCSFLGFTISPSKSFVEGPFRESCGGYFFNGTDVKPIFFKKRLSHAKTIFTMANSIRACAHRLNSHCGCDKRLLPAWKIAVRCLPDHLKMFGEATKGDVSLHANFDEATPSKNRHQWEGWNFPGIVDVAVAKDDQSQTSYYESLRVGGFDKSSGNMMAYRGVTKLVRKNRISCVQWYNFGPWISRSPS